ncbi:MAG: hypothetical protein K2X27_11315 [Candidatus Obscuribacterales bacterium]|nr:hypothetical protein [Candidatus Obscuribacterales bacterium]
MERKEFREQMTQRYVAGKALDGASAEEIAGGVVDPVKQMEYLAGRAESSGSASQNAIGTVLGALFFVSLIVILLFSGFLQLFQH